MLLFALYLGDWLAVGIAGFTSDVIGSLVIIVVVVVVLAAFAWRGLPHLLADGYRGLKLEAIAFLGLYALSLVLVGIYVATANVAAGVVIVLVVLLVLAGFGRLGWRAPVAAGVLLIIPGVFPIAFFLAVLGLTNLSSSAEVVIALAWLVGPLLLSGLTFIVAALAGRSQHRLAQAEAKARTPA